MIHLTIDELQKLREGIAPRYIREETELDCAQVIECLISMIDGKWLPYPNIMPPDHGFFLATIEDQPGSFLVTLIEAFSSGYEDIWGDPIPSDQIRAFIALPAPYKPEERT